MQGDARPLVAVLGAGRREEVAWAENAALRLEPALGGQARFRNGTDGIHEDRYAGASIHAEVFKSHAPLALENLVRSQ